MVFWGRRALEDGRNLVLDTSDMLSLTALIYELGGEIAYGSG